ncbi:Peptidase propeptide and YPEB domain protein [Oceanobacillus picturae]|uniref:Peptidase propeptide and YPEB domain protein n=1 Tax=Oceanobacillus picturae TaxID=171693 RepID=W9AEG5_9BACI|nr:PepSY domain-containing protein [Oceanobacillus picturae]CDO04099.1 Peptidase propeptide and YPEB domain protein [Oceanobacillus picturae]
MKKKTVMMTVGLVVLVLIGFGIFHFFASSASPDYSKKDITQVITAQYPGKVSEPQLNEKEGFYEAVVDHEGNKYIIKVDANTGEVKGLELTEKRIETNTDANKSTDTEKETGNANTEDDIGSEKGQEDDEDGDTKHTEEDVTVSMSKAKEIALERFPGKIDEAELDEDDGRYLYEIKIINGNEEAELEIDAFTGEILYQNIEVDDD